MIRDISPKRVYACNKESHAALPDLFKQNRALEHLRPVQRNGGDGQVSAAQCGVVRLRIPQSFWGCVPDAPQKQDVMMTVHPNSFRWPVHPPREAERLAAA